VPGAAAAPAAARLRAQDRRSVMHPFSSLALQQQGKSRVLARAAGVWVWDIDGRDYIDAGSGLWCVNVGYGREELADAMAAQCRQLSYGLSFGSYSNAPMIELAEKLMACAPDGLGKVLFNNSGSEANDANIKIVRLYNNLRGKPDKKKIISRHGGYHGSTIGSGSLTGHPVVHRHFDLPIAGVLHAAAPDYYRRPDPSMTPAQFTDHLLREVEEMIEREGPATIAAFIAEPVMGSCGVIVPPDGYFAGIQRLLERHDILLVVDEVITGFGRLGAWFGSDLLGLRPDLLTCAKGMTSGYFPMSACLIGDKVWEVLTSDAGTAGIFGHGLTTAGHPVGAAVALANIGIIEREGLVAKADECGTYLLSELKRRLGGHTLVGDIRGVGMMCGLELDAVRTTGKPFPDTAAAAAQFSTACWDEGLMVRGGHGKVMAALAPPLVMSLQETDELVRRLGRALDRMQAIVYSTLGGVGRP